MDLMNISCDFATRNALLNRLLNGDTVLEFDTGAVTIEIKTVALQRMHGGLIVTAATLGSKTPTKGNTFTTQAASTTCYYVVTLTNAATAAMKIYKCVDGEDKWCWKDLETAFAANEIPIIAFKAVTTALWTPLTDFWSDADVTVTGCALGGVIPVAKPSDLTYNTVAVA